MVRSRGGARNRMIFMGYIRGVEVAVFFRQTSTHRMMKIGVASPKAERRPVQPSRLSNSNLTTTCVVQPLEQIRCTILGENIKHVAVVTHRRHDLAATL
jgi:hypothetical protein